MTGPAAVAGAGAAGAGINKIATAFIGIAPVAEEKEFFGVAQTAVESFKTGFLEGAKFPSDPFVDQFVGRMGDYAQTGVNVGTQFFDGLNGILQDKTITLDGLFKNAEDMFKPLTDAADKAFDHVVSKMPVVGKAFEQYVDLFGGLYRPLKEFTVAFTELGDDWLEVGRVITGQSLDMSKVEELKTAVADIFSTGLIIRPQDIIANIGAISTRLDGLSASGVQDFAIKLSQANEILGDITINTNTVTGAMNAFSIEGIESTATLNRWTNIVRESGAGEQFNQILTQIKNIGPSMRQLGYDADTTARTFAQMNEGGEAMARMVWAFSTGTKKIEEQVQKGVFDDTKQGWNSIIIAARQYLEMEDKLAGRDMAIGLLGDFFGARGAATALEAIEQRILLLPEEAKKKIQEMQGELDADIGLDVDESASLTEQFRVIQLQIKSSFQELAGGFADGLQEYANGLTDWLDNNRAQVITWAGDVTEAALTGLSQFINITSSMLIAFAPVVQIIKEIVVETFQWIGSALVLFTEPFKLIEKGLKKIGIDTGDAFANFSLGVRQSLDSLQTLDDFRLDNLMRRIGDAGQGFATETIPGLVDGISETADALAQRALVEQAFKIPGKNGARDEVGIVAPAAEQDGSRTPGTSFYSDRNFFLKGDEADWERIKQNLADLGAELDFDKDGKVTKLFTADEELQKSLDKLLRKFADPDFSDGPTAPGRDAAPLDQPVNPVPSLEDMASGDYGNALFPPDYKPSAWERRSDGTFVVPAAVSVVDDDNQQDANTLMTSMGIPSELQDGEGVVIPVSYQMQTGGMQALFAGLGGGIPGGYLNPNNESMAGLKPQSLAALSAIQSQFPDARLTSGFRADGGGFEWHPDGRGLDLDVPGWQTAEGVARGNVMAAWIEANKEVLGVANVLWQMAGHYNHIHVSIKDQISPLMSMGGLPGLTGGLPATFPASSRIPAVGGNSEIAQYIAAKAMAAGYSPAEAQAFVAQALGESGLDASAYGATTGDATGGASGIFQFTPGTWSAFGQGDVFNAKDNIDAYFRLAAMRDPRVGDIRSRLARISVGGPAVKSNNAPWEQYLQQAGGLLGGIPNVSAETNLLSSSSPILGPGSSALPGEEFVRRLIEMGGKIPAAPSGVIGGSPVVDRDGFAVAADDSVGAKIGSFYGKYLSPEYYLNKAFGAQTRSKSWEKPALGTGYIFGLSELSKGLGQIQSLLDPKAKADTSGIITYRDLVEGFDPYRAGKGIGEVYADPNSTVGQKIFGGLSGAVVAAGALPFPGSGVGRQAVAKALAEEAAKAAAEQAAKAAVSVGEQKLRAGLYQINAGDRTFNVEQLNTNTPGYGSENLWWTTAADDGPELGVVPQLTKAKALEAIKAATAGPDLGPEYGSVLETWAGGGTPAIGSEVQQRVYNDLARQLSVTLFDRRNNGSFPKEVAARRNELQSQMAILERDIREDALVAELEVAQVSGDFDRFDRLSQAMDEFMRNQENLAREVKTRARSLFAEDGPAVPTAAAADAASPNLGIADAVQGADGGNPVDRSLLDDVADEVDSGMLREDELASLGYKDGSLRARATAYWEDAVAEQRAAIEDLLPNTASLDGKGRWWNEGTYDEYLKSKYAKRANGESPEIFWEMPEEDFRKYASGELQQAFEQVGSTAQQRGGNYQGPTSNRLERDPFLRQFGVNPIRYRGGKPGREGAAKQAMREAARAADEAKKAEQSSVPSPEELAAASSPLGEPMTPDEINAVIDEFVEANDISKDFAEGFINQVLEDSQLAGRDILGAPGFAAYANDFLARVARDVENEGLAGLMERAKGGKLTFDPATGKLMDENGREVPLKAPPRPVAPGNTDPNAGGRLNAAGMPFTFVPFTRIPADEFTARAVGKPWRPDLVPPPETAPGGGGGGMLPPGSPPPPPVPGGPDNLPVPYSGGVPTPEEILQESIAKGWFSPSLDVGSNGTDIVRMDFADVLAEFYDGPWPPRQPGDPNWMSGGQLPPNLPDVLKSFIEGEVIPNADELMRLDNRFGFGAGTENAYPRNVSDPLTDPEFLKYMRQFANEQKALGDGLGLDNWAAGDRPQLADLNPEQRKLFGEAAAKWLASQASRYAGIDPAVGFPPVGLGASPFPGAPINSIPMPNSDGGINYVDLTPRQPLEGLVDSIRRRRGQPAALSPRLNAEQLGRPLGPDGKPLRDVADYFGWPRNEVVAELDAAMADSPRFDRSGNQEAIDHHYDEVASLQDALEAMDRGDGPAFIEHMNAAADSYDAAEAALGNTIDSGPGPVSDGTAAAAAAGSSRPGATAPLTPFAKVQALRDYILKVREPLPDKLTPEMLKRNPNAMSKELLDQYIRIGKFPLAEKGKKVGFDPKVLEKLGVTRQDLLDAAISERRERGAGTVLGVGVLGIAGLGTIAGYNYMAGETPPPAENEEDTISVLKDVLQWNGSDLVPGTALYDLLAPLPVAPPTPGGPSLPDSGDSEGSPAPWKPKVVWEGTPENPLPAGSVPPVSSIPPVPAPAAGGPPTPGGPTLPDSGDSEGTPPAPTGAPPAAPVPTPAAPAPAPVPVPAAVAPPTGVPPLAAAAGALPAESGYVPTPVPAPGAVMMPPGFAPPSGSTNPYGTPAAQYDPYTNLPPYPLTPEEYRDWELSVRSRVLQDQNRAEKAGENAAKIGELEKEIERLTQDSVDASAALQAEYDRRAQSVKDGNRTALDSWLNNESNNADSYKKLKETADKAKDAKDASIGQLNRLQDSASDQAASDAIAAERPYPQPPGGGKNEKWKSDKDAESLGRGLVKGVLEEFGFDATLFSNPLEWGITKFLMGGANYGLGLMQNMNPAGPGQGGPYPGAAGPSNIPGSIVNGAAAEAGFSGLSSLFQPSPAQRPGAVMPAPPSAITAAGSPSQDPGVAAGAGFTARGGDLIVNAIGLTDPKTVMAPAAEYALNNGRTTAPFAPGGVPQ